jgi:hypothetical protein
MEYGRAERPEFGAVKKVGLAVASAASIFKHGLRKDAEWKR